VASSSHAFRPLNVRLQMVWDNLSYLGTEALARLA
jgi:hypothetical protein